MNIIQELESLKSYVASLAKTDEIYCTFPPQHGFAAGATVEGIISKIDLIEDKLKKESEKDTGFVCSKLNDLLQKIGIK